MGNALMWHQILDDESMDRPAWLVGMDYLGQDEDGEYVDHREASISIPSREVVEWRAILDSPAFDFAVAVLSERWGTEHIVPVNEADREPGDLRAVSRFDHDSETGLCVYVIVVHTEDCD